MNHRVCSRIVCSKDSFSVAKPVSTLLSSRGDVHLQLGAEFREPLVEPGVEPREIQVIHLAEIGLV